MWYTEIESPIGSLRLVADEAGLRRIDFLHGRDPEEPDPAWESRPEAFEQAARQLHAYFAGQLTSFDLVLAPQGTSFQKRVWDAICEIPYGETITYGELAQRIGNPKGSRAVGLANGSNPIPIVIPCHRVIGSDGRLTGYGGGLPIKERLLALEARQLTLV
jgi:methylated-DNA-[protein]-cysteine S-methyltransferase